MDDDHQDEELLKLAKRAWEVYHASIGDATVSDYIVHPMPILYFGDLPGYENSELHVVTMGINPSGEEFPEDDRLKRLPAVNSISGIGEDAPPDVDMLTVYLSSLNEYFEHCSHTWFDAYESRLGKLSTSYFEGARNRAIHTDFHTPLATSPTWGQLRDQGEEEVLSSLTESGSALWKCLAAFLSPRVVVTTIRKEHVRDIVEEFAPAECLQGYSQKGGFGCDRITINGDDAFLVKVNCLPGGQPSPKSLDRAFDWLKPKL